MRMLFAAALGLGLGLIGARAHAQVATTLRLEESAQSFSFAELFAVATRTAPAFEHAAFEFAHADAAIYAATGVHNWTIRGTADFNRRNGAPLPPATVGASTTSITGQFGIAKLLPTNGTLELLGEAYRNDSDFSGSRQDNVTTSVKLRLTQPLLRNAGFAAAAKDRDAATLVRQAGDSKLRGAALTLAAELGLEYWRVALLWRALDIRRSSLDLAEKQRKQTEAGTRTGKLAASELIPVEAAIVTRQQELLETELQIVEASLEVRRIAGLEVTATEAVVRTEPLPTTIDANAVPDLDAMVALALRNSPDLAGGKLVEQSAALTARFFRKNRLPKLDLRVEAGPLGNDTSDGSRSSSFSRAVRRVGDLDGYVVTANLSFEMPLGNDLAKGAELEARATLAGARHELVDMETKLASEVIRSVYQLRAFAQSTQLAAASVNLAEQNVAAEQKKYELGKSNANEIIRLQDALEDARLRQAQAIYDFVVAQTRLDAYTGVILEKQGISIRTQSVDLQPYIDGKGHDQ